MKEEGQKNSSKESQIPLPLKTARRDVLVHREHTGRKLVRSLRWDLKKVRRQRRIALKLRRRVQGPNGVPSYRSAPLKDSRETMKQKQGANRNLIKRQYAPGNCR